MRGATEKITPSTTEETATAPEANPNVRKQRSAEDALEDEATGSKTVKSKEVAVEQSSSKAVGTAATLHCFGHNLFGQLGFQCVKRKFPALVPSLEGKQFIAVACGALQTFALEANGKVWSFGVNDNGELGRPTAEEEDDFEPGIVKVPGKVIQISAGDSHSAALTEDGMVYAWGVFKDPKGYFGLVADEGVCRETPELITSHLDVKIKKIASGSHHIAMLGEDGHLYTCGDGSQGQLGRTESDGPRRVTRSRSLRGARQIGQDDLKKQYFLTSTFVKVGNNTKLCDIWTGEFSTYCLSDKSSDIYVCGLNNYAQLGVRRTNANKDVVVKLTRTTTFKGKVWKQIAGGQHHAVALDTDGRVYTIGRASDGRLGLGETGDKEYFDGPQAVEGLADKTCIHVAAGGSTSYAITSEGHLYSWGFGENFQLATGDDEDRNVPTRCLKKKDENINGKVICAEAGGQHVGLTIQLPSETDINGN